jgi:hypothetical protein
MEAGGTVVGAVILIFSTRRNGSIERTHCNVTAWFVEPTYRIYATALVSRVLNYESVIFVNISASPRVQPVILAQGFQIYSRGQYIVAPALHLATKGSDAKIVGIDIEPGVPFDAADMELLSVHAGYGCVSLWCVTDERAYPFVFLPRLFKGLLPGVRLIYCRATEDLVRFAQPLARFLLLRGKFAICVDANGPIPGLFGKYFEGESPRFFKGPTPPRLGDLAYSQAAMFPWPWTAGAKLNFPPFRS